MLKAVGLDTVWVLILFNVGIHNCFLLFHYCLMFHKTKGLKNRGGKVFWHHNVLNTKDMQADH